MSSKRPFEDNDVINLDSEEDTEIIPIVIKKRKNDEPIEISSDIEEIQILGHNESIDLLDSPAEETDESAFNSPKEQAVQLQEPRKADLPKIAKIVGHRVEDEVENRKIEKNEIIEKRGIQAEIQSQQQEQEPVLRIVSPQEQMRALLAKAAEARLKTSSVIADNKELLIEKNEVSATRFQEINKRSSKTFSRIHMISNPEYCKEYCPNGNKSTVSLYDLVGSTNLAKSYQFNFLIDFDYIAKFVRSESCQFIVINQNDDEHLMLSDENASKYKVKSIDASKRLQKFGSHHSKLMINFFHDNTCQIIIHTMNLTNADYVIQTQMAWLSPKLKLHKNESLWEDYTLPEIKTKTNTGLAFKRDFIAYLKSYQETELQDLIQELGKYDFSPIDVIFIGSSPGRYATPSKTHPEDLDSKTLFGYGRLWQIIHGLNLQSSKGKFIGQPSTIAGPIDSNTRNIFVHLLTSCIEPGYPLLKKKDFMFKENSGNVEPVIVWPTIDEVIRSKMGVQSGRALHFTSNGTWKAYANQFNAIRRYFHKWSNVDNPRESKAGRSHLSPHVKTYCVTEDDFKTLKWFMLTSANFSHQAWGKPDFKWTNGVLFYSVMSYETGVLVAPKLLDVDKNQGEETILVPTFDSDKLDGNSLKAGAVEVALRLPYDVPLHKYGTEDEPWAKPKAEELILRFGGL